VSGYAAVFVVVAVMVALWGVTVMIRRRREGERPHLGDADAFEGNLLVPPANGLNGQPSGRVSPGHSGNGHSPGGHGHGGFGGHGNHGGGHDGGGGGHH
jgi:uncharacterized membrane protein YgcG